MDGPSIDLFIVGLFALLIGALAIFAGAALEAMGDLRLRALAETDGRTGRRAEALLGRLELVRVRLLMLRLAAIVGSAALFVELYHRGVSVAVLSACFLALLLFYGVLGELAAALARRRPGSALGVFRATRPLELAMAPLAFPVHQLTLLLQRFFPIPQDQERKKERLAALEVEQFIEQSGERGSIEVDEAKLLLNVLEFKKTVAREIMVPRTRLVAFEIGEPIDALTAKVIENGHSRYPVYRGTVDRIVGILYAKDLFAARESGRTILLENLIRRPVFFTPESKKIDSLLGEMRQRRVHLAIVVDEFGGVEGLVTLEDIVEEIVGDIQDEHDLEEALVRALGPGRFLVSGEMNIYDLEEFIGDRLCDDEEGESDSIGGLVVELIGHLPAEGASVQLGDYECRVASADERSVRYLELIRRADNESAAKLVIEPLANIR